MEFFLKNIFTPIIISILTAIVTIWFVEKRKLKRQILHSINSIKYETYIPNLYNRLYILKKYLIQYNDLEKNKIVKGFFNKYLYSLLDTEKGIYHNKIDFIKDDNINQLKKDLEELKKEIK